MFKLRKSVSLFTRIKQRRDLIVDGTKTKFEALEKRVAGTFAEKWLRFWMNLARDYRDVSLDLVKEIRAKPSKAIIIGTSGWLATAFALHNPNATHFRDTFLQAANDSSVVHHTLVKPDVLEHLKFVESCYNCNLIRHTSFGLFSIVWVDQSSKECKAFATQCNYLKLGYTDIPSRIIDIGFLDTWWVLVKNHTDRKT